MNTEELLKQHTELKAKLESEGKARKKAETTANRLKKSNEEMQKRVGQLEEQVTQLQSQMALVLQHFQESNGTAAAAGTVTDTASKLAMLAQRNTTVGTCSLLPAATAAVVPATEIAALKAQLAAHEKEMGTWRKFMADLGAKLPSEKPSRRSEKAANGVPKVGEVSSGAAVPSVATVPVSPRAAAPTAVGDDDVRARAIAARLAQAEKPPAPPTIPEFLTGGGSGKTAATKRHPEVGEEKQKKRVRHYEVPPAVHAETPAVPSMLRQAWSAGVSEAGPPIFADVAVAALRAVMGADAEPPSETAVQEAVRLLNPHGEHYDESMKRYIVTVLSCAVLECAAPAPSRRLAGASLSPQRWFIQTPQELENPEDSLASPIGVGKSASGHLKCGVNAKGLPLPSFIGVWCSTEMLEKHALAWLLHCIAQLSEAVLPAAAAAEATSSPAPLSSRKRSTVKAGIAPSAASQDSLTATIAKDLAAGVVRDITRTISIHSPTERCAAAAAAAALWRSQGDAKQLQIFLLDLLLAKPGNELEVLAPLAAAIESWPEAVPVKGGLGLGVQGVLFDACLKAKKHVSLEIRLAAKWLMQLGMMIWSWEKENVEEERAESARDDAVDAARRQLAKYSSAL